MLYAKSATGKKITAYPKASAFCPNCEKDVIAKCGAINVWHWAHKAGIDCDPWCEGESVWHERIKRLFPVEWVEVSIEKDGIKHRADILTPKGLVIELQHSFIDPETIKAREVFYEKILWFFDVQDAAIGEKVYIDENSYYTEKRLEFYNKHGEDYSTFRWKHPKRHIATTAKPTILDIGEGFVFLLKKMYNDTPCGGWGYMTPFATAIQGLIEGKKLVQKNYQVPRIPRNIFLSE